MKKIIYSLLILIALTFCINVNAEDTFTTSDGIVVKKVVNAYTNGSIDLKVSNINLSNEGNYTWGISKSTSSDTVSKWYVLGDINESKKTTNILLTIQENNILSILRETNTVYLFIKNNADNSMVIDGLKLDVTLPPLYAFKITDWLGSWYLSGGNGSSVEQWEGATYNIENAHYKFKKITDEKLIENYKKALVDGTNLSEVFSVTTSDIEEIDDWVGCTRDNNYPFTKIDKSNIPTDQGAYYLYLKAKDTDSKTVYGVLIVNIDSDGPTVERIFVKSPESGTYKTGQTVKIAVVFSEAITGSTVPTLKIKFGDSAVRAISNGTIVNASYGYNHYIEYSYDIQSSDKGQLATVDLSGGNIKDSSGNDAKLSCPVMTGNTIKANVEGTTTTNTENQDKNNDKSNSINNKNEEKTEITNKETEKDQPLKESPATGVKTYIALSIVLLVGLSGTLFVLKRKNLLKKI